MNKSQAQERADRIQAFRDELRELELTQILVLNEDQRRKLYEHHDELLRSLASRYDVDTTGAQKQLSWGMRIVSFLGAAAISAAVFFFFYRFWGELSTPVQVAILIVVPILTTLGVEVSARKEKTLYFAAIIGLVAFAAFVLNLSMLGQIFNITPTQNAFLAWAGFAFILAYTYDLRLLLVAGIICLFSYLSATIGTWSGIYWLSFGERPENFIGAGIVLFGLSFIPHQAYEKFPPYYRLFGLLGVLLSIVVLSHWGNGSYIMMKHSLVEYFYQIMGFVSSGLVIWLGIKRHWPVITNLGSTFFTIFLYTKIYDWWWDWMPKYLFFLVIGLVAILFLLILKRLRALSQENKS